MGTHIRREFYILSRLPKLLDKSCHHCYLSCFGSLRKCVRIHKNINSFIKFRKHIFPKQVNFISHT